jgi:molecular chaperone Hsp33
VGSRGLGEALVGALLIGSYCKPGERVNLNIQGSGFYKQALVDAHPDGSVRGFVIERSLTPAELKAQGDVGPWGSGVLSVLRTKGKECEKPYIGTVELLTGHLAKDLTYYWAQSEQIPSAVGVVVNHENGEVAEAGGFLIQALPGASPAEVRAIERHINDLQSLARELAKDADPLRLLSRIFQDTAFIVLEERPLELKCSCSLARVERTLTLVGPVELRAMLDEAGHATVRCDFCTKEYLVDAKALERLIAALQES